MLENHGINCQAQLPMEAPVQQWWRPIGGSGGMHGKWLLIVAGWKVYLLYKICLLLLMYFTFSYLFLFPCYFGHVAFTWVHVLVFLYSIICICIYLYVCRFVLYIIYFLRFLTYLTPLWSLNIIPDPLPMKH